MSDRCKTSKIFYLENMHEDDFLKEINISKSKYGINNKIKIFIFSEKLFYISFFFYCLH